MSLCSLPPFFLPLLLLLLSFIAPHAQAFLSSNFVSSGQLLHRSGSHHGNPTASDTAHRCKGVMGMSLGKTSAAEKLRELLDRPEILIMPCCYDGLTARLVEDAGFPLTFMTGFGVSGAHGLPDTQARDLHTVEIVG